MIVDAAVKSSASRPLVDRASWFRVAKFRPFKKRRQEPELAAR